MRWDWKIGQLNKLTAIVHSSGHEKAATELTNLAQRHHHGGLRDLGIVARRQDARGGIDADDKHRLREKTRLLDKRRRARQPYVRLPCEWC